MILMNISLTELEHIIDKTYKQKKCRNLLKDRILNGYTYRQLIAQYYSPFYLDTRREKILINKIYKMVKKIELASEKEINNAEVWNNE